MNEQHRQGDVFFVRMSDEEVIPKNAIRCDPERGRYVLAEGEATGHAHVVPAEGVTMAVLAGMKYLEVTQGKTFVTHEEHDTVVLGKGLWEVFPQMDYRYGAATRVQD